MKLDNLRLLTVNFDNMFLFYRDKLGLKVAWGNVGEPYAHFVLPDGGDIALFDRTLMAEVVGTAAKPATADSQDSFVLGVRVKDIDNIHRELEKKGINFINQPTDREQWGIRTAHFRDPDGNLIELLADLKSKK